MKKHHDITDLHFKNNKLVLNVDGVVHSFDLQAISKTLSNASEQERRIFDISPSGYGIHWPLLDEDLSVDGLLGIPHAPKNHKEQI